MLRFLGQFQADFQLKSGWIRPLRVGGHAPFSPLGNAVDTISGKVDTINTHIDNVLKDAPTKLKVSVRVDDVDWKKIQDMFDKQHEWMTTQMQKHIREVNQMFYEERRRVQERYKEYDGTYLGHYVQYFFWFFFVLGLVIFGLAIFLMLDSHYHWTK